MTALPERLQDEYGDALDELWKSRGCNNDDPLYLRFLPYHATIRQLASELQAAQSLQAQEAVKETTINHARDPHCCGCYVIRWNDGDPVAVCGECGVQVALLDRLVAPDGWEVYIVCDWKDADPFPRFIEAEIDRRSVCFDWRDRADGLKELVIPTQGNVA